MTTLSNILVCGLVITTLIHNANTMLRIERVEVEDSCRQSNNRFCLTNDYFDNPTMKQNFCGTRKARCQESDCRRCTCAEGLDTFISYTHGCMKFKQSQDLMQGK